VQRPQSVSRGPRLLRNSLNGVPAEFCVLIADFLSVFILGRIVEGLRFFEALPLVYGNALGRGERTAGRGAEGS
jgi:hypothetical protein